MIKTRRQNAKADANPSKTVFSKEQNDLKINQVQEYSLDRDEIDEGEVAQAD